jgi:hypothetical protein
MPGLNDSYFVVAFEEDAHGDVSAATEPLQVSSAEEAIEIAERLSTSNVGATAWKRHAEPAVGELGPPEVLYSTGRVGDFG